jgi:oligopeptide transport system substrate-binding protein
VIRIPTVGIYFYIVNSNLSPLDTLAARVALAHSIDRNELVNKYTVATGPAYNMIPLNMTGLWSARAKKYLEIVAIENPFQYLNEQQKIVILYNLTELNQLIADDIGNNWTNLFNISKSFISVSYDGQDWDNYLRKRDVLKEYHVSRAAWILESNNMLTSNNRFNLTRLCHGSCCSRPSFAGERSFTQEPRHLTARRLSVCYTYFEQR